MFPRFTLALTRNPDTVAQLAPLCPALTIVGDLAQLGADQWESASVVIIGADMLADVVAAHQLPPRVRATLAVVHADEPMPPLLDVVGTGAEAVYSIPDGPPGTQAVLAALVAELLATRGRLVEPEDLLDVACCAVGSGYRLSVAYVEARAGGLRVAIGSDLADGSVRSVPLDGSVDFLLVEPADPGERDPRYCRHGNFVGGPLGPDYVCRECEDGQP